MLKNYVKHLRNSKIKTNKKFKMMTVIIKQPDLFHIYRRKLNQHFQEVNDKNFGKNKH